MRHSDKSTLTLAIRQLQAQSVQMRAELLRHVQSFEAEVMAAIKNVEREMRRPNSRAPGLRKEEKNSITPIIMISSIPKPLSSSSQLTHLSERRNLLVKATKVLSSLYYPGMEYRHQNITTAHHETCRWAYESTFTEWIRSADPLFWVSGLMRSLYTLLTLSGTGERKTR
jgi:hypothetical protein